MKCYHQRTVGMISIRSWDFKEFAESVARDARSCQIGDLIISSDIN